MAFWGVEVKSGKPFTHCTNSSGARLHVSQATLGNGSSEGKCTVQCNLGYKSPVLLCSLFPNRVESCPLDLEFDESSDVIFSVIGPRTVYLTGYYLDGTSRAHSDSHGEDIADSETEASVRNSEEDKYEDSFINDGAENETFPSSSEEMIVDEHCSTIPKRSCRRLRKKYRVIESDSENCLDLDLDSETKKTSKKKIDSDKATVETDDPAMIVEDLSPGDDRCQMASLHDKVCVNYTGRLKETGEIIDCGGTTPFKFRLGKGVVIEGWDVGIQGMRVGAKRRLTIPPSMGFGSQGSGSAIPPNSWLIYDIHLLSIR